VTVLSCFVMNGHQCYARVGARLKVKIVTPKSTKSAKIRINYIKCCVYSIFLHIRYDNWIFEKILSCYGNQRHVVQNCLCLIVIYCEVEGDWRMALRFTNESLKI